MESKFQALLRSRKFWSTVVEVVAIVGTVATGEVESWVGLIAFITAVWTYKVGTGIEAAGQAQAASAE